MRGDVLRTRLCELLGTDLPVLVAVPGGPGAPRLASAVAAAGALPVVETLPDAGGERCGLALGRGGAPSAWPASVAAVCVGPDGLGPVAAGGPPVLAQVASVRAAADAVASGADALVVAGADRQLARVPEIKAVAGDRPVIAVAGSSDGAVLAALLCLGASGVWLDDGLAATVEAGGGREAEHVGAVLQRMADRARAVLSTAVWTR